MLQGIALVWESYKLDPYVQKLADGVLNLQEKVPTIIRDKSIRTHNF